jgi:ABC-2 type transport system permease protein
MSVISTPSTQALGKRAVQADKSPFLVELAVITRRSMMVQFREFTWVFPMILGVFFLLVYNGSLSGAASSFLEGQSYLGFILPLSVISTALSASGAAGQSIVRDIESGYFDKLLLTPVSRSALLLGPMIASAFGLVLQVVPIIGVAMLMGLQPVTGLPGVLVLLGYALLVGLALAGIVVGVALRTNSAAATNGVSFLFFPLTFLTATFTPVEMMTGWIRTAAEINPITPLLEATRALLNTGWETDALLRALVVTLLAFAVTFTFAYTSLRARTTRR